MLPPQASSSFDARSDVTTSAGESQAAIRGEFLASHKRIRFCLAGCRVIVSLSCFFGRTTSLLLLMLMSAGGQMERCEEITIPMCRGIGYNYTSMPNKFHHDTQDEAGLEVHQFWPAR
ncbi:frizzled-5 [Caerostris extrusa]|uniref:Frizzled-5 n=1 Tax=Caerostris extrusa TaxID=172846 RepID=A0AAV4N9Y2_CAEEX|nr:frizzled-5 [Caerostris extrusa]